MFRTFKLAIAKVLDALEPSGEAKSPYAGGDPENLVVKTYKTVESAADFAATAVLRPLFHPTPLTPDQKTMLRDLDTPDMPGWGEQLLERMQESFYAMSDARRDLGIKLKEPKS